MVVKQRLYSRGWVGGWVGGWGDELYVRLSFSSSRLLIKLLTHPPTYLG